MAVKITICDDVVEDIELLASVLYEYEPLFEITSFTSGKMMVNKFIESNFTTDILFLDIYMPEIDGIKMAQEIRNKNKDLKIIFISSSKDHYPDAYEVFAFNYILKPFSKERLYTVLDRALDEIKKENRYKICLQHKGAVYNVDCRDILYIESQERLLFFYLADKSVLQCYGKIAEIQKELPEEFFIRCHQSFIINLGQVTEMKENFAYLGQAIISISRKYVKNVKEQYYAYLFSHMDRGK